MLRRAREWQGEVQPVCPVDKLQAMRPAPELYGGGPSPVSWTGPRTCGDGARRAAADIPAGGDEREDLHGQGDGDQRPKPCGEP